MVEPRVSRESGLGAHRALTDCHTTLGVVRAMASAPRYAEYQPPRTHQLRTAIAERLAKVHAVPKWKWVVLGVGVAIFTLGQLVSLASRG